MGSSRAATSMKELVILIAPCLTSPAGGAAMLMWVWAKSSATAWAVAVVTRTRMRMRLDLGRSHGTFQERSMRMVDTGGEEETRAESTHERDREKI